MTVTENVHVPLWGLHAYTSSVDVESKSANLHVDVDIHNAGSSSSQGVRARMNLYVIDSPLETTENTNKSKQVRSEWQT